MIDLRLKNGTLLQYDEAADRVLVDGKVTNDWLPSFIPNGNDEPDFFGFVSKKENKCYNIYGGISNITEEDSIKL